MFNNYNLCHIKTINWEEIITGSGSKFVNVYNFTEPERDCPQCHESCDGGCWGEGAENCQKVSKINCSSECNQGRCFGPKSSECCHSFCIGGCTGPKPSDCLVINISKYLQVLPALLFFNLKNLSHSTGLSQFLRRWRLQTKMSCDAALQSGHLLVGDEPRSKICIWL